jgi:hypothetical protein
LKRKENGSESKRERWSKSSQWQAHQASLGVLKNLRQRDLRDSNDLKSNLKSDLKSRKSLILRYATRDTRDTRV